MANVKNYGLIGVGQNLQFAKGGVNLQTATGAFTLKAADGTTNATLTAAGITSSAGNITLTTGDLVASSGNLNATLGNLNLSALGASVVIGTDTTLSRQQAGVFQFNGTAAVLLPSGSTAQQPTSAVAGMVRYNNQTPGVEYYDGSTSSWKTLATGGSTGAIQTEINNIEATLGAAINSDGTYHQAGFPNVSGVLNNPASFTDAINQIATAVNTDNNLNEIFPSTAIGNIIYAGSGNVWTQAAPGATSGVQAYNATLQSLASNANYGLITEHSDGTVTGVSLVAPSRGFTITNPAGLAGNPTFVLSNNLAALEADVTPGYYVITGDGTSTSRTFAAVSGQLVITGDATGVTTNTTYGLATVTQANTGNFVKVTLDTFGRVTGNTAVVTADITALTDSQYVRQDGTSPGMTGSLNLGGNTITNVGTPVNATDAANKNYVDNAVSGLSWKEAAAVGTTGNIALSGLQTIDGYTTLAGDRVLVKNQTTTSQNGIYVAAAGAWARSTDASTTSELDGAAVFVFNGTVNKNTGWVQTTTNPVIGTDPIVWAQFSGAGAYSAGEGLTLSGTVFSVNEGAGITSLPTGEVGIDLYNPTTGALILTDNGTGRATDANSQLFLLLDTTATGGLDQNANGLFIKAAGVTNTQLVNSSITIDADTGTGSVSLGGTTNINGTALQGISTTVSGSTVTITAANATTAAKGVASFNSASFSTTAGAVSLLTVDVPHGGTGVTTFVANEVLYGNGASPIAQSANFTFDGTSTLTVGGALPLAIDGATGSITATATNGDLVLMPNGTGSVIVGPVGAGLIQSDVGTALTVQGNTTLTLASISGSTSMVLAAGTSAKVDVSNGDSTGANYATGLAPTNLVNKYYVDQAISTGASAGAIKAFQATIPLNTNGATNIGTAMPAGATILSVKVNVTVADASAVLTVGKTGSTSAYMAGSENDPSSTGLYVAEDFVTESSSVTAVATVTGSTGSGSGSCVVIVTYQVAQ